MSLVLLGVAAGAFALVTGRLRLPGTTQAIPPSRPRSLPPASQPTTRTPPKGTKTPPAGTAQTPPTAVLLRVAAQAQFPLLPNGCEVTSLSMLLGAVGHPVSKMRLARLVAKDPTPRVLSKGGAIVAWGNPNVGFVGDMYVHPDGFGVYHGPIARLVDRLLPGRAIDLTGDPFTAVLAHVAEGTPVEVWTTVPLSPDVPFVTWQSPEGPVHTTLDEHAVVVVGYSPTDVFINNPFNGEAAEAVPIARFEAAWRVMGAQAVTVAGLRVAAADRCTGSRIGACAPTGARSPDR